MKQVLKAVVVFILIAQLTISSGTHVSFADSAERLADTLINAYAPERVIQGELKEDFIKATKSEF